MDNVHFLNITYIIVRIYEIFTGSNIDLSQIPSQTITVMTYIAWIGLALSALFLFLFFYLRGKLHAVEHAGWHARDATIEEMHKHRAHQSVNPHWEHVLRLAGGPTESDWRRAIIEADIMLDNLLTDRGYIGDSLGDKIKSANRTQFTTADLAMQAHRVRNDIAHRGAQITLSEREARATIDLYRRVFEEFDYL